MTAPNIALDNITRLLTRSNLASDDLNAALALYLTAEQAVAYKLVCEGRAHTTREVREIGAFKTLARATRALDWLVTCGLLTREGVGGAGNEWRYAVENVGG